MLFLFNSLSSSLSLSLSLSVFLFLQRNCEHVSDKGRRGTAWGRGYGTGGTELRIPERPCVRTVLSDEFALWNRGRGINSIDPTDAQPYGNTIFSLYLHTLYAMAFEITMSSQVGIQKKIER